MKVFRNLLLLSMFAPVGVVWGQSSTFMRDDGSEATESKRSMIMSESTAPESKRYVPSREATTEKQARERRMFEVSTSNYKFYEIGDRRTVNVSAKSMGIVDVQSFRGGGDRAKEVLKQLLSLNRDMLGGIKLENYTFEIEEIQSFGNALVVRFHQLINGVQLPTSTLAITESGEAKTLLLETSSGSSQHFDKSMWLSSKEATALIRDLIVRDYGEFKPEYVNLGMQLRAVRTDEGAGHIVVFQMGYAATIYQIDAISGALHKKQSTLQSERHCQRDSGNPVHCADFGATIYTENGVCVTAGCLVTKHQDAYGTINSTRTELSNNGIYNNPANDHDLIMKSPQSADPLTNVKSPGSNPNNNNSVIFLPAAFLNKSLAARNDIVGHEWGHHWMGRVTSFGAYVAMDGDDAGDAYQESVADLIRALTTNDWTQLLMSGSRVLSSVSNNYEHWTSNLGINNHEASEALSYLYYDFAQAFGVSKALLILQWQAAFADEGLSPSTSVFDLGDYRESLWTAVDTWAGLSATQKLTACSIWHSHGFPGTLGCTVPNTPSNFTATFDRCDWFWSSEAMAYSWGSWYYLSWADVSGEADYLICANDNIFSPIESCTENSANDTDVWHAHSYPNGMYYGLQACSQYGCSDAAITFGDQECGG